ncbi:MAG: FG-GAP-like repeat-containing protein [Thermoanaerobaculia bacterium]
MTKNLRVFSLLLVLCLSVSLFAAECETALVDGTRYHLADVVALVASDVDSDGRPDLVAANSTERELKVLHNDGDAFTWSTPIALSHAVLRLYAVDIDGNGQKDIVATGRSVISVLLANGNGTYRVVTSPATNLHTVSALGEFTSDSKIDLAAFGNDRLLRVYAGNTDGTFTLVSTSAQPIGKQRQPGSVAAGELTRDTNNDLVITGDFGAAIYVGDGHGSFTAGLQLNTSTVAQRVAVDDFDNDTLDDILLRIQTNSGVLHLGKDAYAPGPRKFLTCPGAAATVDLDGDGKLDGVSDTFAICKGNGDGTFTEAWTGAMYFLEQVTFSTSVSVADFNGDGRLDVAGATPKGEIGIFYAKPQLQFTGSRDYEISPASLHADTADLNGDGRDDIITGGFNGLNVFLAGPNGILMPRKSYPGSGPFVVTDLNADTKPDVFFTSGYALTGAGDGTFVASGTGSSQQYGSIAAADLNGDGKMDFVAATPETTDPAQGVWVILRSESGYTETFYSTGHNRMRGVAAGDVTGDSIPDVFALGHNTGTGETEHRTMLMLPGRADGTLGAAVPIANRVVSADALVERIDGDAHNDLVFATETPEDGDAILILRGAGNGTFTEHQRIVIPANTNGSFDEVRFTTGDFDANGLRDIVALLPSAEMAWVLLQNSDHFFELGWTFIHSSYGLTPVVGDFNGDDADDLAVMTSPSSMDVHLSACRTAIAVLPPRVRLSGPSQSADERPITFFASVDAPGAGGTVAFYSDDFSVSDFRTLLGTAPVIDGVASLKLALRGTGARKLHAVYSGDGVHATATSNAIAHVVMAPTGLPRRRAVRR